MAGRSHLVVVEGLFPSALVDVLDLKLHALQKVAQHRMLDRFIHETCC